MNTKVLGEITDEVVPREVNHRQCNLTNVIFLQVVNLQVQELQKKKYCGCKIDHPSQRRHDARRRRMDNLRPRSNRTCTSTRNTMETVQGRYLNHELIPHDQALKNSTLELLMNLMFKADLSEYLDILGYLHYWQKEQ